MYSMYITVTIRSFPAVYNACIRSAYMCLTHVVTMLYTALDNEWKETDIRSRVYWVDNTYV